MRSRELLARLDRLCLPPEPVTCPDLSLLSPEDYDRVMELFEKCENSIKGKQPTISSKELKDLQTLLEGLPTLGPDDRSAGPKIEVPGTLDQYWRYFHPGTSNCSFDNLGKVQRLRFVELCSRYGWKKGISLGGLRMCMIPLSDWHTDDKMEMQALLGKAAAYKEPTVLY